MSTIASYGNFFIFK